MVCEVDRELLRRSVERQNEAIDELETETHEMRVSQNEALEAAERRIKEMQGDIARISKMPAVSCQDAERIIDEAYFEKG